MSVVSDVKQVEMILRYKKILGGLCGFENRKQITEVILTFWTVTHLCARSDVLAYFYTAHFVPLQQTYDGSIL